MRERKKTYDEVEMDFIYPNAVPKGSIRQLSSFSYREYCESHVTGQGRKDSIGKNRNDRIGHRRRRGMSGLDTRHCAV